MWCAERDLCMKRLIENLKNNVILAVHWCPPSTM